MSKRTRGSSRTPHRRPGSRPTSGRSANRPRAAASPEFELAEPMTIDEVIEAEVSSSAVAETSARPEASARPETSATVRAVRAGQARQRVKPGSLLATRAATEYVYVTQDLKRITLLGVLLFGALIVLWLLLVVLRVVPLPFY